MLNLAKEIESLTKKLVSINSVDGNEKEIADYIESYLRKLSYFKNNPNQVINFECDKNRNSVIAYLKGKGKNTIILMGHIDTVDIKDYGKAIKFATDTNKLPEKLKEYFNLSESVIADIKSNNYMFARGTLDMKAGVAAYLTVFKYFSEHIDELNGNLLLLCECDEEGDSKGIIKALDKLIEIKDKEDLEYVACLNGDYSTSDDLNRNVYLGTVGKLLPCFVAIGKESHVGSPFYCFDPNLLLSIINKNISLNPDFTDSDEDKASVPPICLKQTDNKDFYTVQTASSAILEINYLIYNSSPLKVMENCLKVAKESFNETIELLNLRYKNYCKKNSSRYTKLPFKAKVFSYKEWKELLSSNPSFEKDIEAYGNKLLKDNPGMDIRDYSYELILKSYEYYGIKEPVLIVFFGSSFYSSVKTDNEKLVEAINDAIKEVSKDSKYSIKTSNYYPYISDMSFLSTPFNEKQISEMKKNCPFYVDYPFEKIKKINVPVVNIGTYGKDGHTYIERLEKDYSFNEMPNLVYLTVKEYFK